MATNEPKDAPARSRRFAWGAILAGTAIAALSFLPALSSGRERWTTEQALEYQDASMRIQELTHQLGRQSPDTASKETSADFQDAIKNFQDLSSELADARARHGFWAISLRVVGIVLVLAGMADYLAATRR